MSFATIICISALLVFSIYVREESQLDKPTPTPISGGYDLALNACQAKWYISKPGGSSNVRCPSKVDNKAGLVIPVQNVTLNDGKVYGPTILL